MILCSSQSQPRMKLSEEERKTKLEPLLTAGWSLVEGRDAIHKDFQFKDFNEVFVFSPDLQSFSFLFFVVAIWGL